MNSQTSSTPTKKLVRTLIDSKGDTLVEMKLSDARFILSIVLDKDITDSIIRNYEVTDSFGVYSNGNFFPIERDKAIEIAFKVFREIITLNGTDV